MTSYSGVIVDEETFNFRLECNSNNDYDFILLA